MSFAEFRGSEEFKEIREAEENAQLNQNSEFNDLPDTIKVKESLVRYPISENSRLAGRQDTEDDFFYFEMDKNTKEIKIYQNDKSRLSFGRFLGTYNIETDEVKAGAGEPGIASVSQADFFKSEKGKRLIKDQIEQTLKEDGVSQKTINELLKSNKATNFDQSSSDAVSEVIGEGLRRKSYEKDLCYPTSLRRGSQDRLQIDVREFISRTPANGGLLQEGTNQSGERTLVPTLRSREESIGPSIGRVFLPVPAGIQDFNGVSFNSGQLNPVELAAAQALLSGIDRGTTALVDDVSALVRGTTSVGINQEELKRAVASYFVGQGTGVGQRGILTRTENAVLNPNLELLFSGPTLRPFNFTFKMSPRDRGESIVVRKIIRMFKQSSAVQTTESGLFLRAPNAYTIKFLTKGASATGIGVGSLDDTHDFLPKIKTCALLNCSVNYTPDGSYMTYENSSMVAYTMTLRFQELEPIFNSDYTELDGDSDQSIGF